MNRFSRFVLLFAAGAAVLQGDTSLPVPTEAGSNVTIKLTSPVVAVPRFGFLPIKIAIENLTSRDGVWHFRFNAGSPASFPGMASSVLDVAVPSAQTRETWFFVPIAEPGVSFNPSVAAASSSGSNLSLGGPPTIDTVWPVSPSGVGRPP
jgi:hypothetical protein